PPGCLLRLPATPGDTWDEELPVRTKDGPLKMKYTTGKEEDVEVPAGKFRAVRVEAVSQVASSPTQITYWFAAGVGSVKIVYKDTGPKGGERVTVRKSFEPGTQWGGLRGGIEAAAEGCREWGGARGAARAARGRTGRRRPRCASGSAAMSAP